jgi:hypothetical protein
MYAFNIKESLEKAKQRTKKRSGSVGRRPRRDRGTSRVDPAIIEQLSHLTSGQERPAMQEMLRELAEWCGRKGHKTPSRATVYHLLTRLPGRSYDFDSLPKSVQAALYNFSSGSRVPGHQLAFYCFNYGDLTDLSFAAGLPWLALYQAVRLPGYRRKSRGLAEAAARARGL